MGSKVPSLNPFYRRNSQGLEEEQIAWKPMQKERLQLRNFGLSALFLKTACGAKALGEGEEGGREADGRKARELTEGQSRVYCWLSAGWKTDKLDGAMVLEKQKPEESGGPDGTKRQDHRLWGWESWKNRVLWSADDVSQVEMRENDGLEPKMRVSREQRWTPPGGV